MTQAAVVTNSTVRYLFGAGNDKASLVGYHSEDFIATLIDVPDDVGLGYTWDGIGWNEPSGPAPIIDPEAYAAIVEEAVESANQLVSAAVTAESTSRTAADAALQAQLDELTKSIPVQTETGTSYDVLASNRGELVTFNNASAVSVTLPQAGGAIVDGWYVWLANLGAGTVTVTPSVSTINGSASINLATDETLLAVSNGINYFGALISVGGVTSLEGRSGAVQFVAGDRAANGLNIDAITTHGDSDYTILATDRIVATSAALTGSRTFTLPAANAVNAGQMLLVTDLAGGVTATNYLTIARSGSDTINGAASIVINCAYGFQFLWSDGSSKWFSFGLSLASGISAFLSTPSSANLAAALTDETGSGTVVFSSVLKQLSTGAILPCGTSDALSGTLLCNGAAYSRTTYADLFAAIGTAWGAGDGSTTFNVPDFRGEFPRGWDNGRGVDSGRALGSSQGATRHPYLYWNSTPQISGPSNYAPVYPDATGGSVSRAYQTSATPSGTVAQYYTSRPRNVACNFCIVY